MNGFTGSLKNKRYRVNNLGNSSSEKYKQEWEAVGQERVFRFWKELSSLERRELLTQLGSLDIKECQKAVRDFTSIKTTDYQKANPPSFVDGTRPEDPGLSSFKDCGEEQFSLNKVAAFMVAGGQGTRLGHSGPKGTLKGTPISGKSLFQHFSESLTYFNQRFGFFPFWLIMTSPANHNETVRFFEENNNFGIPKGKVRIFPQDVMPVFDKNGTLLLEEKHRIATSPNGHGGAIGALQKSGVLKLLEDEGVEHISYFQVDNPLVYCMDPVLLAYMF